MKHSSFHEYQREDTERSEAALLTIWPKLADFHEDLVLVGGLVPRYLCRRDLAEGDWQPRTLDVDLAIALAADGGMYEGLSTRLISEGFRYENGRFTRDRGGVVLHVDLLTERLSADAPNSAEVTDLTVSAFFGVDRALKGYRRCLVVGRDLNGAQARETVKVCEVGPFLCLKLQAYARRAERKDAFDFVHTLLNYDGGPRRAAEAFQAEEGGNLAFGSARRVLEERFADESSQGPMAYAAFCLGDRAMAGGGETEEPRAQLTADAVTAAFLLLGR